MNDLNTNPGFNDDFDDYSTLKEFNFPGRKIAMGIALVGIICQLIDIFAGKINALMWTGATLIIGSMIYMFYWAIRRRKKRVITRLSIYLILIAALFGFLGYLNHIPEPAKSAPTENATAAAAHYSLFSDPLSIAMLITIIGLLMVLLITIYYRFVRHDQEALDKWLPRSRYIRIILILIPIIVIAFTWLI